MRQVQTCAARVWVALPGAHGSPAGPSLPQELKDLKEGLELPSQFEGHSL